MVLAASIAAASTTLKNSRDKSCSISSSKETTARNHLAAASQARPRKLKYRDAHLHAPSPWQHARLHYLSQGTKHCLASRPDPWRSHAACTTFLRYRARFQRGLTSGFTQDLGHFPLLKSMTLSVESRQPFGQDSSE